MSYSVILRVCSGLCVQEPFMIMCGYHIHNTGIIKSESATNKANDWSPLLSITPVNMFLNERTVLVH